MQELIDKVNDILKILGVLNYKRRHRINTSTSTKGIITFDSTFELLDGTLEEALAESDKLTAELLERYPINQVDKK